MSKNNRGKHLNGRIQVIIVVFPSHLLHSVDSVAFSQVQNVTKMGA